MTILIDTEGEQIPPDDGEDKRPLFDADLCDWNDGRGPILTINTPSYFETEHGVYDSCGVITTPIKDVLEEYLRDFKTIDGGDGIKDFISFLRKYSDRLESIA
jgi:hypothetical protein